MESVARRTDEGNVFIAEVDSVPAATLTLTDSAGTYLSHLPPPGEPERYVHWLAPDRRFQGLGVGSALLAHAAEVTGRAGVALLRVDCFAGDGGKLVRYYESNGFVRTETYRGTNDWPGQVLARRV